MAEQTGQEGGRREGQVVRVAGPLVVAKGLAGTKMYETVRVGKMKLFGEVIEIRGDQYSIQVYEETEGVGPGEPVVPSGAPLSVELGPGLVKAIYDGIQRPLDTLRNEFGDFIVRGAESPALDRKVKWTFEPKVAAGAEVVPGDVIGTVQESKLVLHKIMVPPGVSGKVAKIAKGEYTVEETVAVVETATGPRNLQMMQKWPVRHARQVVKKFPPTVPLVTGQRVIDMFFPMTKGGTACVPGPFGSGKTVVQHQLAKWADADIIVYVGCGERGNEMTDVLMEFPELADPKSGEPLMERTVLVANTSNMPVAAREASVFTGITIAEYFRDMGYDVAMMADSTSRWAEAMREISGRLEEMPGEEGYPAYLGSRIATFYERSGSVQCLGREERKGSLSIIGAVSPPGGDLSDPVVQATLRVVKVFWGLDASLAYQRHFPAISWLKSYSLYQQIVDEYADRELDKAWSGVRKEAMAILQREEELEELVRLVGLDALSAPDRLLMEASKSVREDFLHQNAFDDIDTYSSLKKQLLLLQTVLHFYAEATKSLQRGSGIDEIASLPIRDEISRAKLIKEQELDKFQKVMDGITEQCGKLGKAAVKAGA
ncbi:MAG TPA: V-type ATP synthase subunit A [Candidatus Brocadiia bacterium]|nr:V-type ATP synthase subunit A [Candidatus Brocadiia bacterium]